MCYNVTMPRKNNTKNLILKMLEEAAGNSISGEVIATTLGISRSAIWKAIKDLRNEGYVIEAVTNRGYKLVESIDKLSKDKIQGYLQGYVNSNGDELTSSNYNKDSLDMADDKQNLIYVYSEVDSTNHIAKKMAMEGATHGSVVIADTQTNGHGRFDRKFHSPLGCGIYMSFILKPDRLPFKNITSITAYAALAVARAIEETAGADAKIKWVNDVYIEDKKVCGILCEGGTDFETGTIGWIVVGIGVNVKTPEGGFDASIKNIAGSVSEYGQIDGGRNHLAAALIKEMMKLAPGFSETDMINEYRSRMCMLGERVKVSEPGGEYEATAINIDDNGHLIVKKEDGSIENLMAGEISVHRV